MTKRNQLQISLIIIINFLLKFRSQKLSILIQYPTFYHIRMVLLSYHLIVIHPIFLIQRNIQSINIINRWNCKIIERQHIIHNYDIKIKLELHWPNYDKAQIIKGTYLEKIYYKTAEILKNGIVHIKNRINKQEQVKRNKQYMYNQNRIYKNMSSQYQRDEYYEQQRKSEILTKLINKNKTCTKIDKYQYKSKSIWIKQQQ